jgi:hypothetical protein
MTKQYNVLFDIGFSIVANDERGETLKPSEIRYAIIRRAINICDDEIKEAVGFCDSYILEESNTRPHCSECGYEWSAMLGENEVPTKCECGGEVTLP